MKLLFTACLILTTLFAASIANCRAVTDLTDEISRSLSLSQSAARAEDWHGTAEALSDAQKIWAENSAYLHVVVDHDELDEAESLFAEIGQYALQQNSDKYCTFSECLRVQLDHIQETQQFSVQNVL